MLGDDPWFDPLGRRLLTLGLALAWVVVELIEGSGGLWLWAALAVTAYVVYALFIRPRPGRTS